jgi:magnesium transporter
MTPETLEPEVDGAEDTGAPLDERGSLTSEFIRSVSDRIEEEEHDEVRRLVEDLRPADIADLIEQLGGEQQRDFVTIIGPDLPSETLSELDTGAREWVLELIPNEQIAEAITELDTDEAAYVLGDLDEQDRADVLAEMPIADRLALQAALDYPEESAGRIMQRDVFAAPSYWQVGEIIDRLRSAEQLPETFYDVYVVDPGYKVLGIVPLSKFIKAPRDTVVLDLITPDAILIGAEMDQEEVAYLFEKYNLISAPVVDGSKRLVGMITVDDVVEIVHEEADEDMLALAGVAAEDSSVNASVRTIARSRFIWLLVNLGTAILASFVIGLFDATIQQMVALAILMPIVASMGGNAATQTMTVAVRNLSTRNLTSSNAWRAVGRETAVSLINGAAFAVLMGVAAALWYGVLASAPQSEAVALGCVLAAAMIINMICAGLAGILVPIALDRSGQDPAVSSSVFVTTVTDVVGFFAFLGLAAIFLV